MSKLDCTNPQGNWERYHVRVLGEAGSYAQAREKLRKAEMTSDLQTDSEAERGPRRRRKRKLSSSESEEEANEFFKPPPQPTRKLLSAYT
ncbi:hypothetical protein SRHO_G00112880 [Serrasalmus rhombeus]